MFQRATKKKARLRLALNGPAGSGKTYSALAIASGLGGKIAVIDTEHGSASKYADRFDFDVCELTTFDPRNYIKAIKAAEQAGYDTVILDSLSHAWNGTGGVLEVVENAATKARGNTYAGWKEGTPLQNQLIEAMLQSRCHVIATMRAKTEYVLEKDDRGKTTPRKIGMAPVQRDGMEYEFDVAGLLDVDNNLAIEKTRCPDLRGAVIKQPGADLAKTLMAWLSDGSESAPQPESSGPTWADQIATADSLDALGALWRRIPKDAKTAALIAAKDARKAELSADHGEIRAPSEQAAAKRATESEPPSFAVRARMEEIAHLPDVASAEKWKKRRQSDIDAMPEGERSLVLGAYSHRVNEIIKANK